MVDIYLLYNEKLALFNILILFFFNAVKFLHFRILTGF